MFLLGVLQFAVFIVASLANEASTKIYSQCGQTINQRQFILQSTGYPNGYPANIHCDYILQGHDDCQTEFHFQFLDFDLENSVNCSKDRLEVTRRDPSGIEWKDNVCGFVTGIRRFKTAERVMKLTFVSDYNRYGRGFKILITRQPCNSTNNTTVAKGKNSLPHCCATAYNARRFYLASPGFPYTNRAPTDCLYYIYRANPNICRLRIHFKFFWSGIQQGVYCPNGFFEIDGKTICGCRTGLDVVSQFDQFWGNQPKVIRFRNEALPRSIFSGFVVEVIQDECPARYSPSLNNRKNNSNGSEKIPEFYFYNDQLNRISYPNLTVENISMSNLANETQDLNLVNRTQEKISERKLSTNDSRRNKDNMIIERSTLENHSSLLDDTNVKVDYYFFKAPDYDYGFDTWAQRNREPREYFETTSTDFLLPNGNDDLKCRAWGFLQWTLLTKEVLWTKMPQCKVPQLVTPKCCDIGNVQGLLVSPGYPYYYAGDLNICYRFRKQHGYCGVRLSGDYFDLEPSKDCHKDALIIQNKHRYCGNSLYQRYIDIEFTNDQYEDIRFVTDKYFCGCGFKIFYEQLPCEYTSPHPPAVTTPPPPIEESCGGIIMSEHFEINFQNSIDQCVYHINRADQDVCGIQLLFTNFNLLCGTEYLSINNKQYCGDLNGQADFVSFDPINTSVTVVYKRHTATHSPVPTSIVLRGQQIKGDCEPFILDVPAQRRLKIDPERPVMMSTEATSENKTR